MYARQQIIYHSEIYNNKQIFSRAPALAESYGGSEYRP